MARRFLVGGNWKCNLTFKAANGLINGVLNKMNWDPS